MQIDLNELPIPDWDVLCPQCEYPLRGLPSHRCPECGLELDMPSVVQAFHRLRDPKFTGDELPMPDFGLTCRGCREPLAGARRHVCPHCDRPFDPQTWRSQADWFEIESWMTRGVLKEIVVAVLTEEYIPHVVRQEEALQAIVGHGSLGLLRIKVSSVFFFDLLHLMGLERDRLTREREIAQTASWVCSHCGEENPGNFEKCWQCQAQRAE